MQREAAEEIDMSDFDPMLHHAPRECPLCGSIVGNVRKHESFHEDVDDLISAALWVQRQQRLERADA